MNKYQNLKIWSFTHRSEDPDQEFKLRFNSPGTIKTGLIINPMFKGDKLLKQFELFAVLTPEIILLEEKVNAKSQEIQRIRAGLPSIASEQLFKHTLINEIFSTNDIEDVKITRKEVADAISSIDTDKRGRLKSFVRMYNSIDLHQKLKIKQASDIRKAYDELLAGEIAQQDLPDGKIFRNTPVRIGSSLKTIHTPKADENLFMPDIEAWIRFINNDEVPFLLKAFIAHYYFENIHPFNDGNGRLGRYILCSYLGTKLDPLTAITFSSEINNNRSKYYKAFEEVEDSKNYGEITFFIIAMLRLLLSGQEHLLINMYEQEQDLKKFGNYLDQSEFTEIERNCLFIYAQLYLFNDFDSSIEDGIIIDFLKKSSNFSKTAIKQGIEKLNDLEMIKTIKRRPLTRVLSNKFINLIEEH